ncbi:MAG TPA: DUF1801 domain-containing protein [Ktedonobacteraceae bacterium]|nr:DUF1801 domain-containing protein [Ktedonobacteraceae bacterium]
MHDPIEEFLEGYPPEMQVVSRILRARVRDAMPCAREVLFARHNHFAYALSESRADTIVYICPMKEYVRLGFMFGTHLNDPQQLLVGTGKQLRHVKVRTVEEANMPALRGLVEEAWADAQTHMKKRV